MRKPIYIIFVVLLYLFSNGNSVAQKITITGSVKDETNDLPLPYCNISVKNTNYGTVTNSDGEFTLKVDSTLHRLIVSYIGYESKKIDVDKSQRVDVKLTPVSIELGEVIINPYTWAERFVLKAIDKKNEFLSSLDNYSSDAYSKTTFGNSAHGVLGLAESVSKINFLEPDFYYERLLVFKASQHMKNIPYEELAIDQTINLLNDRTRLENISIVSPLYDDALDYYDYSLKKKIGMDNDTVVVIGITPKYENRPLYIGDLYFNQTDHLLMQADLNGNSAAKNGLIDSVKIFQKFTIKDSLYNLPSFTKYSMLYNLYGLKIDYVQEYTFINYSINKETVETLYPAEHLLVDEANLSYNIDFQRDEEFKVPLSLEEIKFNAKIDSIFQHGSILKLGILYFFTDFFPSFFDQQTRLFGHNFTMFSNLYRFNKVEGNYLGFEQQFIDNGEFNITAKAGYAFGAKLFEFDAYFRCKNFSLNANSEIKNLGKYGYLRSIQTLSALFTHKDDINYYKSTSFEAGYLFQMNREFSIAPIIALEKQSPVANSTEFCFFNRDDVYSPNFIVDEYNNSRVGFVISYFGNKNYLTEEERCYKGESFTNIILRGNFHNKKTLNSTENFTEWNVMFNRFQEIYPPISLNVRLDLRYTNGSAYINKMDFANGSEILALKNTPLTLYTVDNYDFYLQDYLKVSTDLTLFKFPEIFGLQISFGGLLNYVHLLSMKDLEVSFNRLDKDFYEYGVTLGGVSFLNFSLMKNNLHTKRYYFKINIGF